MEGWFERMADARNRGTHVQAYADDQILVVSGRSVRAIEREWEMVWSECAEWAKLNRLEYNVAKTEAMFIPARGEIRGPVVRMGDIRIQISEKVKYLGVIVDRKMAWLEHVKRARARVHDLGGKFFALGRRKWGNSRRVLKAIFDKVITPMVLYGAEIWGERARDTRVIRQLRATERPFLRAITKAYRTAPTAALSVLAGCVPLEVQARAMYEKRTRFDGQIRRISIEERPHPAIRGYMPRIQEAQGDGVKVWVDATIRGNGVKAYAWAVAVGGRLETGGRKVEGETDVVGLESWAVWKGIEEGMRRREGRDEILVLTDSQQTTDRLGHYETKDWTIDKIQRVIATNLEMGIKISVEWRRRTTDMIRVVDRECRRVVREEDEVERLEGVDKRRARDWKKEWEMDEWHRLWDGGTTGRWLHGMWERVNRKGMETSPELTQVATGHGDFRAYLGRFRLGDGGGERCGCGMNENEDVEHAVLRCRHEERIRARHELERELGHYPPRLGEIREDKWEMVRVWAGKIIKWDV